MIKMRQFESLELGKYAEIVDYLSHTLQNSDFLILNLKDNYKVEEEVLLGGGPHYPE